MGNNSSVGSAEEGKVPTMGQYNLLLGIVIGVALVCMLAFITMLVSYFSSSQAAFQDLKDQINQQTAKVDMLYAQCSDKTSKIEVTNK